MTIFGRNTDLADDVKVLADSMADRKVIVQFFRRGDDFYGHAESRRGVCVNATASTLEEVLKKIADALRDGNLPPNGNVIDISAYRRERTLRDVG